LVIFAITLNGYIYIYIPLKTNDKIKAKLKSGDYILTEKRYARSEAWKSFREIQDAATKEKTGAVLCVKCHSVLSYAGKKVELPLNRHSCKFSAGQGNVEKHLHPSSLFRPVPQTVKDVVTEACLIMLQGHQTL
jgi:hypothetical protein